MFAVIDVETTGSSASDRIVELAIIVLDKEFKVKQVFDSLLNPEWPIHRAAYKVHGIRDSDVQHAPRFSDVLPHLLACLRDSPYLIAHKADFECRFLNYELARCGYGFPDRVNSICTLALARQLLRLPNHKLPTIAAALKLPFQDHHLAFADAAVTAKIFETLYRPLCSGEAIGTACIWPPLPKPSSRPRLKPRRQIDWMKLQFQAMDLLSTEECLHFIESAAEKKLPADVHFTWWSFSQQKCTVTDFAKKTKKNEKQVYDHLSEAIRLGRQVNIRTIVSLANQRKLAKVWEALPLNRRNQKGLKKASGLLLQDGVFKCMAAFFEYDSVFAEGGLNTNTSKTIQSSAKPPIPSKESVAGASSVRTELKSVDFRIAMTDEQLLVLDSFRDQKNLKVHAFAGAGKTQTLVEAAKSTTRKGLYLSFNRKNAEEASQRFPCQIDCMTTHGLAFRAMRKNFSDSKLSQSITVSAIRQALTDEDLLLDNRWRAAEIATLTLGMLRDWLRTSEESFENALLPAAFGLSACTDADKDELLHHCRGIANRCWELMKSKADSMPLSHDGYLKLWALTHPVIDTDFIMLDEAQDSNAFIVDVLARQSCQKIMVGDRHQQIYGWRGAVDAMTRLSAEEELFLTQTFRFGDEIASYANAALRRLNEPMTLRGAVASPLKAALSAHKAFLARTNATVIEALVSCRDDGLRVHIQGGTQEMERLLRGIGDVQSGKRSSVAELIGIGSWNELKTAVELDVRSELSVVVNVVERFSVEQLLFYLQETVDEEDNPDIVLSTVHKAKGLEWDCVEISRDLMDKLPEKHWSNGSLQPSELRLLYVAVTRARRELILPEVVKRFLS